MILKLIIIIFLIIGLYYLLYISIEKFSNKNYTNSEEIPLEYNKIYSSIPYDIKIKNENSSYYDYGNDELNEKFIKVFNINQKNLIKMVEGVEWSNWKNINEDKQVIKYGNKIIKEFDKKLNNDVFKIKNNPNYIIVNNNINRFKSSNNLILLDIDVIIHRTNRPLARHIKILAVSNNHYVNFLMIKVIGVIKECDLTLQLQSSNDINQYSDFYPEKKILYDMNSFIFDTNDKLVNSEIEYQLYQKLLKELDNK
jgi:hypothetical protein